MFCQSFSQASQALPLLLTDLTPFRGPCRVRVNHGQCRCPCLAPCEEWFSANQHRIFAEKPSWRAASFADPACQRVQLLSSFAFQVCNALTVKVQHLSYRPWLSSSLFTSSQLFFCLQPRIVAQQFLLTYSVPRIGNLPPATLSRPWSTTEAVWCIAVNITARCLTVTPYFMEKKQYRL